MEGYKDKDIVEWLRYGWPSGRLPTLPEPCKTTKNHKGAAEYPTELMKYIQKEKGKEAVMGPFDKMPFRARVGISPLTTRPKKSSTDRRVILDLSFPMGQAINDGMSKDEYIGLEAKLTFPKVDELCFRVFQLGHGCCLFKIDLSRYFRQIPLDPGDYSLIGYIIEGKIYFDKVLPMGMRTAPYIAQRVSNALAHIHRQMGYFLLNYVDNFLGAEVREKAWQAYQFLTRLLRDLQVDTSPEKLVAPTTRLDFLGITFDTVKQTIEIPQEKLEEIAQETSTWLTKTSATRKEAESLIGKLQFVAKCVRAGRIFIARLINWIRGMNRTAHYPIPLEARKDVAWWGRVMPEYNGVSLLWLVKEPQVDAVIATDSCPKGYGGTMVSKR